MNKNNKLLKNTIIYAIGNFGTKVLNFLIVPLYTYYISTEDMGTYDLIIVIITFLLPIVMFQLSDGVYRWLFDADDSKIIIKSASIQILVNCILCALIGTIISYIFSIENGAIIIGVLITETIYSFLIQILRGLRHNKFYAIIGVIHTAVFLCFNVLEVVVWKNGILGLLISHIIAYTLSSLIILIKEKIICDSLFHSTFDRNRLLDMVKYSIPLIPNVVCWSVINLSDRFIIVSFLGRSLNGIYSIAYKFPAIIQLFTHFFYLAWQESAIEEYGSKDRDKYYTNIFNLYYRFLFPAVAVLLPATYVYTNFLMNTDYKSSWIYTGFLYLGTAFSALSGFVGTGYQSSKESKGAFYTTIIGAATNVIINLMCVSVIGLQAAAFSTFIAYLVLFIVRIKGTRKYFSLNVNWGHFILLTIYALVFTVIFICNIPSAVRLAMAILSVVVFFYCNKSLVLNILHVFRRKIGG